MSDSIKLHAVNFTHRVTGQETEEFYITDMTTRDLSKAVDDMVDRAAATVSLVQSFFGSTSEERPDDRTIYYALNSVAMELADIQKTVELYHQAQKKPV